MTGKVGQKGNKCPYAEKTGRAPVLCQEGYCQRCQIWHDFKLGKRLYTPIQPFKREVSSPCWWRTSCLIQNHRKYTR